MLNWATPLVLAPLFGVPSGMYRLHHTVMHHVVRPGADMLPVCLLCAGLLALIHTLHLAQEGNHPPKDISSTEAYQRDSIPHFFL